MKLLIGFAIMLHAGYSLYQCRVHRLETNSLDTHIPLDVIISNYLK